LSGRGCFGTSLALPNQVPMRLESTPTPLIAHIVPPGGQGPVTSQQLQFTLLVRAGKFKLTGIACGNCELQQPASMLHDVRVLCPYPVLWHV
ncbi:hypothetical protein KCU86_g17262, partial [Aureobasidium melanogenum]